MTQHYTVKGSENSLIALHSGLKLIWEQVEPFAEPARHYLQRALHPAWEALRPYVGDSINQLNHQLRSHEPLALVAITAVIVLVVVKLMGTFRRITNLLVLGLLLAYLYPYVVQHLQHQ